MIVLDDFSKGYQIERVSYQHFIDTEYPIDGWEMEDLGESTWSGNNIYGFSLGDVHNKPVLFFDGAIHGSEWQTAHELTGFMRVLANPQGNPNQSIIERLKTKFAFYVIPLLNPWGYENNHRGNINGVDLNRNFDWAWEEYDGPYYFDLNKGTAPFSENETQILRDKILELRPVLYSAYHTHGGGKVNTKIHSPDEPTSIKYRVLLRDLMESMRFLGAHSPFLEDNYQTKRPAANSWVATIKSKNGIQPICNMPEVGINETVMTTPEANPIQMKMGINLAFLMAIYAEQYLEKQYLQFNNSDLF